METVSLPCKRIISPDKRTLLTKAVQNGASGNSIFMSNFFSVKPGEISTVSAFSLKTIKTEQTQVLK